MAQQAQREIDERFNEVSDRDAFWGPLIGFRPEKRQCISSSRVLTMACTLGAFYGMLLNLAVALIFRRTTHHHLPSVLMMPAILSLTYFIAFQITLGPLGTVGLACCFGARTTWTASAARAISSNERDQQQRVLTGNLTQVAIDVVDHVVGRVTRPLLRQSKGAFG